MEELKSRGVKKGGKREWDIFKNREEFADKKISIRITTSEYNRMKELQKTKKVKFRDMLILGLEKLENKG